MFTKRKNTKRGESCPRPLLKDQTTTRYSPTSVKGKALLKLRYNRHMYNNTFQQNKHKNSTSLSKCIWDLKDNNIKFSIKRKVIKRCKAYNSSSKKCNLCLNEKFLIICHPELGWVVCNGKNFFELS